MGYRTATRHRITPEHAQELDVAWFERGNPAVAFEVQISGSLPSAITNLTQAKKFNYRKVIIVIREKDLGELNRRIKFDDLRFWLDAWSVGSVYEMYTAGEKFFSLYANLEESKYRDRKQIELV